MLRFPSAVTTAVAANNTVEARIVVPRDVLRPIPVVILLHFWGAQDLRFEERVARQLNARGIAAAIMTLPYHLSRSPEGVESGQLAIQADTGHLREATTQAVMDVRRLIDWIEGQRELDSSRIGLSGVSMGAIIGSLTLSVDPRIRFGTLLLAGGDVAHMIWTSTVTVQTRMEFRRLGYDLERLRKELAPIEPLNFASADRGGDVLVVGARFDDVIPQEDTRKLIAAFGQPEVVWLDTGHYGGALVERRLNRLIANFFQSRFTGRGFRPPRSLGEFTVRVGVHYNTDYKLTLAAGLDLWRSSRGDRLFVSGLAAPQGVVLFGGRGLGRGFSAGMAVTLREITWGLFWSIVL